MRLEQYRTGNNIYLRIASSHRESNTGKVIKTVHATLGNINNYDDGKPDLFERLREKFNNKEIFQEQINQDVQLKLNRTNDEDAFLEVKNLGYIYIDEIYKSLGIDKYLNKVLKDSKVEYELSNITKLLTYGRILNPETKIKTLYTNANYHFSILGNKKPLVKEHVYRTLDILSKHSMEIQRLVYNNSRKMINRNEDIIFYDLTNYYFETKQNFEDKIDQDTGEVITSLGKKGVSKENRKGPIVQMGLLMDKSNFPIGYELFPGNTIDKVTLRPMIEKHFNSVNIKKGIVVADRIINTKPNLDYIYNNNLDYVISRSIKRRTKDVQNWVKDELNYQWLNKNETFKYKSKVVDIDYLDELGNKQTRKEKWVVYWSKKHYDQVISENNRFKEYLESVVRNPDKLKDNKGAKEKYLKKTYIDKKTGEDIKVKVNYEVNNEKIEKELSLLGYYLITTSKLDLEDLEVIDTYRNLGKIEDMFKTIKTTFEGRPIHVKTNDHINAHFLTCYLALLILRIIQDKTKDKLKEIDQIKFTHGLSSERIVEALNSYQSALITKGIYKVSKPTEDMKLIEKSFGINKELRLPTNKEILDFKRLIKTNK